MATLSPPLSPQGDNRPRLSTMNSYQSHRSRKSSGSQQNKLDLVETSGDKRRLTKQANPITALAEAQPIAQAQAPSTLQDLRGQTHTDSEGNVITDPDRSNPTRYRLERPLDTIRSFHAAAEGTSSNRRSSYQNRPSPGAYPADQNKRTSYYGNSYPSPQGRPRTGGYRNSSYGFARSDYADEGQGQGHGLQPPFQPQAPPYGRPPRQPQQPYQSVEDSPGSSSHYQHSQQYDGMTSGSDDYSKSTNPSSQNSSFDQLQHMQYTQQNGNSRGPYPGYGAGEDNFHPQQHPVQAAPPNNPRQPIKLNTANSGPPPTRADLDKALPQKRQSWIKRKFSKRE